MIKYAPLKIVACFYDLPAGHNRKGDGVYFTDLNSIYRYFEKEQCWEFSCGCKFDIITIEDTKK